MMHTKIGKAIRPLGLALATILLGWFFYYIRPVLTPFLISFAVAYLLLPLVDLLENMRMPRGIAVVLIYLIFIGLLVLLIMYAIPALVDDLNKIIVLIPDYAYYLENTINQMHDGYRQAAVPESIRQVIDDTIQRVQIYVVSLSKGFIQGIIGLLSQTFNLILAPILSYYFLKEFHQLGHCILILVPVRYRPEFIQVGKEINTVLLKFIKGNLLVAMLVAVLTAVGMYLIGMPFPIMIGLLVGITNFIPYFGAIFAAIPVLLLALLKSKWLALSVLGVMLLVQQLEGNIISPTILGDCVGLHPLIIIFALLVGGQVGGLLGMVLAVPVTAIARILLNHIYYHLI